jgi:hypothetical protein
MMLATPSHSDLDSLRESEKPTPLEDPENFCKVFWNNTPALYDYSKQVVGFTREYMDLVFQHTTYLQPYCAFISQLKKNFHGLFKKYSGESYKDIEMLVGKVKSYSEMVTIIAKNRINYCQ